MSTAPEGVASCLPDLNPEQAAWAHHAARLLTEHGLTTSVKAVKSVQADWYLAPGLAFRPPVQSRAPLGAAADALVSALSLQDDFLNTIEQATGLAAEFSDHGSLTGDLACISIVSGGDALGEIVPLAPPPIPAAASPPAPLPLLVAATRLTLDEAEQLGAGDLLLLSSQPWALIENGADGGGGLATQGLAYEPQTGRLRAANFTNPHNHEAVPMSDPADSGQMTVPVALQLPGAMLTQADLASLAETGSIDIGPVAEGLHVTVSVGGLSVGKGEIVRIGDRFAVLVESPAPTEARPPEQDADPAQSDTGELHSDAAAPSPAEMATEAE